MMAFFILIACILTIIILLTIITVNQLKRVNRQFILLLKINSGLMMPLDNAVNKCLG